LNDLIESMKKIDARPTPASRRGPIGAIEG
jgi:hypothetical protein